MVFSRIKRLFTRSAGKPAKPRKQVIPRDQHQLSRRDISENALKVLYRLNKAGYEAYLVGGGVRDVLLGLHPKDFDIATDARPEQIQKVFRNCRLIGRRFRLAHVLFGNDVVEVATFRAGNDDAPQSEHGMVLRDNVYGTVEEDAVRRDFTVNALYYNIADFSIVDFVGGLKDLESKVLRLVGDADTRYREDPVRMLRAARLAAKLGFSIEKHTREPIPALASLLGNVSNARLWDECGKLFLTGHAQASFAQLQSLDLFNVLFPSARKALRQPHVQALFEAVFRSTDARIADDKGINPAFLFAVLLWPAVQMETEARIAKGEHPMVAFNDVANKVIDAQHEVTAIAKRFGLTIREIWLLQFRFPQRTPARAEKQLSHPRFRAGYDLLCLRGEAGEAVQDLAAWWDAYQHAEPEQRVALCKRIDKPAEAESEKRRRPARKRRRKPAGERPAQD